MVEASPASDSCESVRVVVSGQLRFLLFAVWGISLPSRSIILPIVVLLVLFLLLVPEVCCVFRKSEAESLVGLAVFGRR